jgi:hypothetical protein
MKLSLLLSCFRISNFEVPKVPNKILSQSVNPSQYSDKLFSNPDLLIVHGHFNRQYRENSLTKLPTMLIF